jgi:hypothetical protein
VTDQATDDGAPQRLTFPDDEATHDWLACAKGCAACCRAHLTIPVYPLELVGI